MSGQENIDVSFNNPGSDFYNKYLLNNMETKNINRDEKQYSVASDQIMKNILKDKFSLNYTDYEKLKLAEQYNKLYVSSLTESEKLRQIQENKKFYNMSLKQLIENASLVYIELLNELTNFFTYNDKKSLNQLGYIITKGENMLYIGLLIVIIAFSLWLIEVTGQ